MEILKLFEISKSYFEFLIGAVVIIIFILIKKLPIKYFFKLIINHFKNSKNKITDEKKWATLLEKIEIIEKLKYESNFEEINYDGLKLSVIFRNQETDRNYETKEKIIYAYELIKKMNCRQNTLLIDLSNTLISNDFFLICVMTALKIIIEKNNCVIEIRINKNNKDFKLMKNIISFYNDKYDYHIKIIEI